ncbi:MAG: ABC transporter ATP-binding protein [Pseudomonadota bacterium]
MPTPLLLVKALVKRFRADRPAVLDGVDLELQAGEYIAIMGDSGVGKSTLLNLLAGLERPDSGHVEMDGIDIGAMSDDEATLLRRRQIGFVFQAFHVLPYITVRQNVELPLALLGLDAAERNTRALQMLDAVGIGAMSEQYPRDLSGGELQRIAIARALVHRPRLVLADEPTGNLDPRTASLVLALLRDRIVASGGAGILITHSQAVAESADRVYVLDGRSLRVMS